MERSPNLKFFAPLLIVIAFGVVAYVLLRLSLKLSNKLASKRILKSGVRTKDAAMALMLAQIEKSKFVDDFNYVIYVDGVRKTAHADTIIVRKNGIFVVNICPYRGKLDNEDDLIWRRSAKTRHGIIEKTFPSPVVETKHAVAVVKHLLEKSEIKEDMIHGIVIISRSDADTVYEDEGVYRMLEGIEYIKGFKSQLLFERKECKEISSYLNEKSVDPAETEESNSEKRG